MPRFALPLMMMVSLFLVAGCGGGEEASTREGATAATEPGYKIAVVPKGTQHAFWQSVESGAREAAEERGVELVWKGPDAESDTSGQITLLQGLVDDPSIDAVGVAPTAAEGALVDLLVSTHGKGKPVVIFDSGMNTDASNYTSFIATDNEQGGRLGGAKLVELMGGNGKIVMLRYAANSLSTDQRAAGFLEAIDAAEGIEKLSVDQEGGQNAGDAKKKADNMADLLRGADGIFTVNESTTQGMLLALEQLGLTGKVKFVGFDTSPALIDALKAGKIDALVAQNPRRMGSETVHALMDAMEGKQVQKQVDTGVVVVTRENLDSDEVRAVLQE